MDRLTEKEVSNIIKRIEEHANKLISEGREACLSFLVKAGICNLDGTLTDPYKKE